MKRLMFSIALLVCFPVFAQDRAPRIAGYNFNVYHKADHYVISAFDDRLMVTATSMQRVGDVGSASCVLQLRGNVEIRTDRTLLQADEADYHCGTGEIEPRGNVVLKPFAQ